MLLEGKLTDAQRLIIRHICSIQLQSLERLMNDEAHTEESIGEVLERNNITEEKFEDELYLKIRGFEKLHQDPNLLVQMKEDDVSIITHILTNISERYQEKYPKAIKNLWGKLFFIRDTKLNVNYN